MLLGFGRTRVKEQDLLLLLGMADIGRGKNAIQLTTDDSHQSDKDRFGLRQRLARRRGAVSSEL